MNAFLKMLGVSCCCVVMGAMAANADEIRLADSELDGVVAGFDFPAFPPLIDNVPGAGNFPGIFPGPLNPPPPLPQPDPPPTNGGSLPGGITSGLLQALLQLIAGGLR